MQHPIFQIDELLRLVVEELVETSPPAAVSLALACRSLEEPTLSSLWKRQHSLCDLLLVLPDCTFVKVKHNVYVLEIEDDPSDEDWARLHRYSSWMRGLDLDFDDWNTSSDALFRLSSNSPGGVLLPNLKWLKWRVDYGKIPTTFFRLFFSPNLQRVTFYTRLRLNSIPWPLLTTLVQMILSLPTSLENLSVLCGKGNDKPLQDAMSSFICQRGSPLRSLTTNVPVSETAILRLLQLPNLSHLRTSHGPPHAIPRSAFPSLESLHLGDRRALSWLPLLASYDKPTNLSDPAPSPNVRDVLKSLGLPKNIIVDPELLSSVVIFRDLVTLRVHTDTCFGKDRGCDFRLTDEDVRNLTIALPRLTSLLLGRPCSSNTCNTTINSLTSISVNCLSLTALQIHFNTRTIVSDVQRLLDAPRVENEVKCKLQSLLVGCIPLEVRKRDRSAIVMGFKVIFPFLKGAKGEAGSRLCKVLSKLRDSQ